jgi:hypothetical protein
VSAKQIARLEQRKIGNTNEFRARRPVLLRLVLGPRYGDQGQVDNGSNRNVYSIITQSETREADSAATSLLMCCDGTALSAARYRADNPKEMD